MGPTFRRAEVEGSIDERFQRIVGAHPDRPAVREHGHVTTYAELDVAAGSVAAALANRVRAAGPVALFAETGAALLAAMLGTLRAGRFYVPLDPRLPDARVAAILADLDLAAMVADAASAGRSARLVPSGVPVLSLGELISGQPVKAVATSVSPGDLAYVLFTSGSTGRPKGVMQSHRNLLHNTWKLTAGLAIVPEDRMSLLTSPSFGASVSAIYGALLNGASVCPYDLSGDGLRRLPEFLEREGITIYHSVPSVFRTFASTLGGREDLSKLRVVKLGGEPVLASDFDLFRNRFPRGCVFHVGLGATEMSVIRQWSARHDTPWPGGSPLGYAVEETEVVLLDDGGAAADEGEIGVIATTLPVGYWKDPGLTAATFLPVPGRPEARLYRTGDLGRLLPDGLLLYLGRRDARLKVRGHRVETAEVETALLSVPGVREAAVEGMARPEGMRLAAWVVRESAGRPGPGELRHELSRRVPGSMVPSFFVFLDALPRTASGKVDRRALPQPNDARPGLETPFRAPAGAAEAAVARAFALVLGLERVGADDDFFELGGDSLSAVELLASLDETIGPEHSVADFLEGPTPAGLAARSGGGETPGRLVTLREGRGRPVFVVPGGSGDGEDLFAARRLSRVAGGAAPFQCLRSGRPPHPPVEDLAVLGVEEIRRAAPRGPYVLVGDCMGGILAFAIARRLRRSDEPVTLILLDTPFPRVGRRLRALVRSRAPGIDRIWQRSAYFRDRLRYHLGVVRTLPRGRWAYLRRMARTGAGGLSPTVTARGRELRDRRASYLEALLSWKPVPFDGTLHVLESEASSRKGHGSAWRRFAPAGRRAVVPGDHEGLLLEHGEEVGRVLAGWLADGDSNAKVPQG